MKKLLILLSLLLSALPVWGQAGGTASPLSGGNGVTITTVSGLNGISGKTKGTIAVVTDGSTATDCGTGGGTNVVACQYSGAAWAQLAAASSGSSAFSALTAATDSNAGTFAATGNTWDFSGATAFKIPISAGAAPVNSGLIAYDSTANAWKFGQNAATVQFGLSSAACGANSFVSTPATSTVAASCTQPAFSNLSGSIAIGQTPLTTSGDILIANATPALARLATGTAHQLLHGGNTWSLVDLTSDVVNALPAASLSGTLAAGQFPVLAGDVTTPGGSLTTTVVKINGNSVPSGAAVHQVAVATASSTLTWKTITDCNGSSNALNYTQSTDLFSCNNIATLSNPMTTLGDMITGGSAGAVTRLAGPSSPNSLPYTLVSVPAAGAATTPVWTLAGVPVNAQSGAGYTIVATDRANYLSLSNASAQTLTLPAIAGNFASNFPFVTQNIGAGTWTITPTTQNINGNATDALVTKLAAFIYQDSTPNWFDIVFPTIQAFPSCTDSAGNHLNWNSATRLFSCGTTSSGGTFYQTVDANASAQTQRPTLNLISGTNATVSCVDNAGSTRTDCTISASSSAGSRLDQITPGTATNTINSTTFAQVWNWALTGSQIGFTFGENTAATGSGNIILDAQTLASSTALPFQTTARGTANGWNLSTGALWEPIGTGALATGVTAHTIALNEAGSPIVGLSCGAGTTLNGASSADPTCTATPTLGASGTLGSVTFGNATSGLLTVQPSTGAITSYTIALPVVQPTSGNTFLSCTAANPAVCTWAAGGGSTAWSNIGNPSGNLALTMGTNTSTFNFSSNLASSFLWQNNTAATSGANQSGPQLCTGGFGWIGGSPASTADNWCIATVLGSGTNPTSALTFTHSGTTGALSWSIPASTLIEGLGNLTFEADGGNNLGFTISNHAMMTLGAPGGSSTQVTIGNSGTSGTTTDVILQTGTLGDRSTFMVQLKATAALTSGQTVKVDSANANSIVVATTADTGGGVVLGFVSGSPGAGALANVVGPGSIIVDPLLGTGTCSIGQFVINDTTTNGRVKCTGTYTAGTVLGYALTSQASVGSAVGVYVLPR